MTAANDDRIERLARKLVREGTVDDLDSGRRAAARMLEDSEARTFDPAAHDPEHDGAIRRTSSETATRGEVPGGRWEFDGD